MTSSSGSSSESQQRRFVTNDGVDPVSGMFALGSTVTGTFGGNVDTFSINYARGQR